MKKLMVILLMLISFPNFAVADGPEKTEKVVVSGMGVDADKARQNALRNAVEQVVGTFVSSETLVKDSALIKDEILSHSGGYVKESRIISTERSDDLISVKIEAQVISTKLKQKIRSLNIAIKKVDGESLFGEAFTKIDSQKNGTMLFKNILSKYPQAAYKFEVGKPEILSTDPSRNKASVKIPIVIKLDSAFIDELTSVLKQVSTKTMPEAEIETFMYEQNHYVCVTPMALLQSGSSEYCFALDNSTIKNASKISTTYGPSIISSQPYDHSLKILFKDGTGRIVLAKKYSFENDNSYLRDRNFNGTNMDDFFNSTALKHNFGDRYAFKPPNIIGDKTIIFVKDGFMPLDIVVDISIDILKTVSKLEVSMDSYK